MSGQLEPTTPPYAMAKLTAIELEKFLSKQYGHKVINLMPTNLMDLMTIFLKWIAM